MPSGQAGQHMLTLFKSYVEVTLCLVVSADVTPFLPTRSLELGMSRSLQADAARCAMMGARLLSWPSLTAYDTCLNDLTADNSTFDWSVPGAEFGALANCWCANNLKDSISGLGCCSDLSFARMCSLDCKPDCNSTLAQQCLQDCPSMCLEASQYAVSSATCSKCNSETCFPVLKCLVEKATYLTDSGKLKRTCHENKFLAAPELKRYFNCWRYASKHSSHWNIVSAMVHCSCSNQMPALANNTECCQSLVYGGGVCDTVCPSESLCMSQDAQTCIKNCQDICATLTPSPSQACLQQCVGSGSSCQQYLGCDTPSNVDYTCDDGRSPDGSTGCCMDNTTGLIGCPRLCETQNVWRLDQSNGAPWWARWDNAQGPVYQCTCRGCPPPTSLGSSQVTETLAQSLWDNGQVMLVDIARREGLQLGPNTKMQELMLRRNSEVQRVIQTFGPSSLRKVKQLTADINTRYTKLITDAAHAAPDDGGGKEKPYTAAREAAEKDFQTRTVFTVVIAVCSAVIVLTIGVATYCILKRRAKQTTSTPILAFENETVVVGNPVAPSDLPPRGKEDVCTGATVTVCAPTKARSPKFAGAELS